MSASNLLSQEKTVIDRKAYEPSMEEILASIRRIIADDQIFPGSSPVPEEVAEPLEDFEVEPIAEPVKAAAPAVAPVAKPAAAVPSAVEMPAAASGKGEPDVKPIARSLPREVAKSADGRAAPAREVEVSGASMPAAAVQTALKQPQSIPVAVRASLDAAPPAPVQAPAEPELALKGTAQASEPAAEGPLVSPATDQAVAGAFNALIASRFVQTSETMTDMIRDMIRPMLKSWLDDNLPIMVERLVRAEIERVARGGR